MANINNIFSSHKLSFSALCLISLFSFLILPESIDLENKENMQKSLNDINMSTQYLKSAFVNEKTYKHGSCIKIKEQLPAMPTSKLGEQISGIKYYERDNKVKKILKNIANKTYISYKNAILYPLNSINQNSEFASNRIFNSISKINSNITADGLDFGSLNCIKNDSDIVKIIVENINNFNNSYKNLNKKLIEKIKKNGAFSYNTKISECLKVNRNRPIDCYFSDENQDYSAIYFQSLESDLGVKLENYNPDKKKQSKQKIKIPIIDLELNADQFSNFILIIIFLQIIYILYIHLQILDYIKERFSRKVNKQITTENIIQKMTDSQKEIDDESWILSGLYSNNKWILRLSSSYIYSAFAFNVYCQFKIHNYLNNSDAINSSLTRINSLIMAINVLFLTICVLLLLKSQACVMINRKKVNKKMFDY